MNKSAGAVTKCTSLTTPSERASCVDSQRAEREGKTRVLPMAPQRPKPSPVAQPRQSDGAGAAGGVKAKLAERLGVELAAEAEDEEEVGGSSKERMKSRLKKASRVFQQGCARSLQGCE